MADLVIGELTARRGATLVLDRVSLTVHRREIVAVTGPSNAGKTTLLAAIAGLLPCHTATLSLAGRDLAGLAPEARVRCGLVYVPQGRGVFPGMTVRDNLLIGGWAARNRNIPRILDVLPGLGDVLAYRAGDLSQFGRQLCAIGRALMTQPAVLLLDEPTRGLSPSESAQLFALLPDILATGVSILFTDHDLDGATQIADRLHLLDQGRLTRSGTPAGLLTDPAFLDWYGPGAAP